jgi:hypothetical protein
MFAKRPLKLSERGRRADHNFAVATILLMIFFVVGGFATWVFNEKPSVAGISAAAANSSKSRNAP